MNNIEKEKNFTIIMFAITIILFLFCMEYQSNYIQNLEEKLNIYQSSYEEFCLEDSLGQVE